MFLLQSMVWTAWLGVSLAWNADCIHFILKALALAGWYTLLWLEDRLTDWLTSTVCFLVSKIHNTRRRAYICSEVHAVILEHKMTDWWERQGVGGGVKCQRSSGWAKWAKRVQTEMGRGKEIIKCLRTKERERLKKTRTWWMDFKFWVKWSEHCWEEGNLPMGFSAIYRLYV